ncbi:28418_t:CDS:2 [Gigaspora margarita]|uniref:28418_t:CDS:1 n=1 Tax=Gigaspora margarita TaxID=4874 RepID=A0ABN7VSQ3_GIGMA|nr:28418_t:CDS:2 [Gigaspora margarita]
MPNCLNIEQTPEHFTLECPISQKLALELAIPSAKLRVPEHWNDLFLDQYTGKRGGNGVKGIIKDLR